MAGYGDTQAVVVGDEQPDLLADAESGCQMQGIEASKAHRVDGSGLIEHGVIKRQQGHALEKGSRISGVLLAITPARTNRRAVRLQPLLAKLIENVKARRAHRGRQYWRSWHAKEGSALGIVAPRPAARRAIGESGGPEGVSLATSLPRSVCVTVALGSTLSA
jgi:hypothetical protein